MIYLDYSATTPVDEAVLDSFCRVSKDYFANPNSLHRLGVEAKRLMQQATGQVADLLRVKSSEVIFTSSASESNNLAIVGLAEKYCHRNKLILSTKLEHSSSLEALRYLEQLGYEIYDLPLDDSGKIDLEVLKTQLDRDPLLLSISQVNSEIGIVQPISEIVTLLQQYPKTFLHVDGTQSVGKIPVDLQGIDLFTFSAHKFFGLKGIAGLVKKEKVALEPLIHGGKSQTIYRSGTPAVALIVSCAKALRFAMTDLDEKYNHVAKLNSSLREKFAKNARIIVNSPLDASPYILNISIPKIKPETMLHALEAHDIYLSTKTACAKSTERSLALDAMGKSPEIASSSLRVSLSYLTSAEELDTFVKVLYECIDTLSMKSGGQ